MAEEKNAKDKSQGKRNNLSPSPARLLRRIVQAVAFIAFLILLIYASPLTDKKIAADWFPRMSPLAALTTMMGSDSLILKYWPAMVVLVLTILLSRFFCGWICPLGTTIDITDRLFRGRREARQKRLKAEGKTHWLYDRRTFKYGLLFFLILSAIFGIQMSGWFDPLSIAPRIYSTVVHPYLMVLFESVFRFLGGVPQIGEPADKMYALTNRLFYSLQTRVFATHLVIFCTFLLIVLPGVVYRRYWCRNLCPLGGLLGLCSEWTWVKRSVSDSCIHCRHCERICRTGAIPPPGEDKSEAGTKTTSGECILCMDCQRICPTGAIRFTKSQPVAQKVDPDLSKRGLLTAAAMSVAALPVMKSNFPKKRGTGRLTVIRPPGALPEVDFLLKCVRCGECMRICPDNAVHPTLLEAGLEGLWTPRLIPRIGHCIYECTRCGSICPSGALKPLTKEEKRQKAIGLARFNHNRCIPWVAYSRLADIKETGQDLNCGTCEEVCPVPTKAIRYDHVEVRDDMELRLPYIKEELCVGCGYCENVCPVRGEAGVYVEGRQETITVAGDEAGAADVDFFPAVVGDWKRSGEPTVYAGRAGLVKYIDGGAEPYLTYSFKQAVVARYARTDPAGAIEVSVWEFGNGSDAFGAMMKDILPEGIQRVEVGDESILLDNYLYGRKGVYHLRAKPVKGKVTVEDVTAVVKAVAKQLDVEKAPRPEVVTLLPEKDLVEHSQKFLRHQMILDSIYLTDNPINTNVFQLDKETNCAVGDYKPKGAEFPFKLLMTQYPHEEQAKKAFEEFKKLRLSWKEPAETSGNMLIFKDSSNKFSTLAVKGRYLVAVFRSPDRKAAEDLTLAALKRVGK
ncbi:MAG: 4Fe-4S dicluster domain-containing protein [Planctomycetes bacterium]|nr:4Fe-4S dicluster domain-containing protein [Planctomycetota bacterium]